MKNKVFKNFLLLIMISLLLGSSVFATDASVRFTDGHLIVFAPGSVTSDTDLFSKFKGVMPGDTLSEEIGITNEAEDFDYIKVYMQAIPHDEDANPLSPKVADAGETVASMQDFLSHLLMKVYNEGTLIYQDSPDQPGALAAPVLLGELSHGESLTLKVELEVPINLDSDYMTRVGEVDWLFIVEGFEKTSLTVKKVWKDDGLGRPDTVKVNLLKDGVVEETVELTDKDQWMYTWTGLTGKATWSAVEADVPLDYEVSYSTVNGILLITNTKEIEPPPEVEPVDLNVKKVWSDQKHPDSVEVTLFNGDKAVEKVILNAANNWSYSWKDLDGEGDWFVVETNIPKDYKPTYVKKGDLVTITNTKSLPPTGAGMTLHYPMIGSILLALGYTLRKKEK